MMSTTCAAVPDVEWPVVEPIAAERLVAGEPSASPLVTARYATSEIGLWQVTEGEGELVHEDGTVPACSPG